MGFDRWSEGEDERTRRSRRDDRESRRPSWVSIALLTKRRWRRQHDLSTESLSSSVVGFECSSDGEHGGGAVTNKVVNRL
ncbi:hypothetical protein F2Q68_00042880 [Brassica cretica]|uniref:Uncharacterized protein n=2 Tax=Brassica cretica TaxID=69181 RepID=A0ABQ7A7K7_BRACR|nr:hypothetical protein F2Q68_00042880 [Brassica cretica]KAF3493646.1 hypothetical protein DY000_02058380 [Brassica cretica]